MRKLPTVSISKDALNQRDAAREQRTRFFSLVVVVGFIASRLWMLMGLEAATIQPDTILYADHALKAYYVHAVPYRDFEVFYPPVAWWLMAVPGWIESTVYQAEDLSTKPVQQFVDRYTAMFRAEMFVIDTICLGLMWLIGRRMLPKATWFLPAAYTVLTIAQPHLLYERLDLGLLMFFLLSIFCWLKALDSSSTANRWACASYFFLGLGISFKVIPVIFVPFLLLADLWVSRSLWRPVGLIVSLLTGGLGPFLVHMPSAGWGVFRMFLFHAERDLHLESIWSSIILVAAPVFGLHCKTFASHGSWNLASEWSGTLKIVAGIMLPAMAASIGLWALLRGRRFDRRLALDTAILVVLNSTVLAVVFSPQYLNWMLPLALLLALNVFPRSRSLWAVFAVLVAAILGLSSWLFPYHYEAVVALENPEIPVLVARTACMAALALLLDIRFFAKYGLVPWRAESPAREPLTAAA